MVGAVRSCPLLESGKAVEPTRCEPGRAERPTNYVRWPGARCRKDRCRAAGLSGTDNHGPGPSSHRLDRVREVYLNNSSIRT
jgi:hypothetical protein